MKISSLITSIFLMVLCASGAIAQTTPTIAPTANPAVLGPLKVTSSYAGSTTSGGSGTLTLTVANTLAPSSAASSATLSVLSGFTDNTGKVQNVAAQIPTVLTPAVNDLLTGITLTVVVPAASFVPSAPTAGANYQVSGSQVVIDIPSLDGGATFTAVIPGTYE